MKEKKNNKSENEEITTDQLHTEQEADHLQTAEKDDAAHITAAAEEKLAAQLTEINDKYLRLYAEFDNYKRRTAKERLELLQSAGKDVIAELLPVADDFERALKAMDQSAEGSALTEGIKLVYQKMMKILNQKGLKEMGSIGQPFDPELHEAITNIPAPSDDLKGKVIDEIEKGYYLNDRVLRYAKVVVGN